MRQSVNNKLILEPYKGQRKIEATVKSGFATVKQRSTLIGLKLLSDANVVPNGSGKILTIKAGSIVFFEESVLATEGWAKNTYTVDGDGGGKEFVIGEYNRAVFFDGEIGKLDKSKGTFK